MEFDSDRRYFDHYLASGIHIIADCQGIDEKLLNDGKLLKNILVESLKITGATILELRVKAFQPSGVTVFAILAESHASIHTYPALGVAMLDLFTCGKIDAILGMKKILEQLQPKQSSIQVINRNLVEENESANQNLPD